VSDGLLRSSEERRGEPDDGHDLGQRTGQKAHCREPCQDVVAGRAPRLFDIAIQGWIPVRKHLTAPGRTANLCRDFTLSLARFTHGGAAHWPRSPI